MVVAVETVTVTRTYVDQDGEPCSGTVTFIPPCVVRDNSGHTVMSGPVTAGLDHLGRLQVDLPCTEQDGLDPTGFKYQVVERLDCADCITTYPISLPCETAPAPQPTASARCDDDGYTVRVTVVDAIYPITVDWGDGSQPDTYQQGEPVTHTYYSPGGPLDPTRTAAPILGPVALSQARVHQQAATDPRGGEWYATQVLDGGVQFDDEPAPVDYNSRKCAGDLAINRLTATGSLMSVMYARGFDHGAGLGVQRDTDGTLYLWTAVDAIECENPAASESGMGSKIGRFTYSADMVLDMGDAELEVFDPVPGRTDVTPALDTTHGTIGVRYAVGSGHRLTVWTIDDFLAHRYSRPVYDIDLPDHEHHQGWAIYGTYAYLFYGPPQGTSFFYVIDLETGTEIRAVENTQLGTYDFEEPESILIRETADGPQLVWGLAVGTTSGRRMVLFAGAAHQSDIDVSVTVTDGAGTVVTASGVDHIPCNETEESTS